MSFSAKVKREVCRIKVNTKEEASAILSGMMKVSGTISLTTNKSINFRTTTENPAIARLMFKLLKEFFDIHTRLLVKRSNSLKKNNIHMVMITEEMGVIKLLKEVGVLKEEEYFAVDYSIHDRFKDDEESKRAYIRGALLGGGSISNPEKTYHLEFVCFCFSGNC